MGWTFFHKAKGVKAVDAVKQSFGIEWCRERVVAESATREAVFLVLRVKDPDSKVYIPDADGYVRALAVVKIKSVPKDAYNFGYKDMTESMGPYGCEAPLSILAQCSELQDPIGPLPQWSSLQSAREYRERCAKAAAAKALKRGLKPGAKVTLAQSLSFGGIVQRNFTVVICRVRGRKGMSTVFRGESGMLCAISARHLEGAVVS